MQFLPHFIFVSILLGTQICLGAETDSQLIQKVEQLEKELLELKKQHQDKIKPQSLVEDTQPSLVRAKPVEKKEKNKEAQKQDDMEKDTQSPAIPSQAEELYAQAQIFLNQNHPEQAKTVLVNLCESYPESPQYILAKYWLGEIALAARDHTNASLSYGEAYSSFKERTSSKDKGKTSNKEPITNEVRNRAIESLAKLAYCLKQLGKKQDACVTIEQFNKEASEIPYNVRKFALQVGDQLKCQKKPQL